MASDATVSIPSFVPGTTNYKTWIALVRDRLLSCYLGLIFRMPDPRERQRFTGSSRCTQVGHPKLNTTPAKESPSDYEALCDAQALWPLEPFAAAVVG